MRFLQIVFLISFALFALLIPYFIFNLLQGEGSNTPLIIFVAVIFVVNLIFIIRKLFNRNSKNKKFKESL